ncbi:FCD domain-containing protein [Sinorhizobium meliloti]
MVARRVRDAPSAKGVAEVLTSALQRLETACAEGSRPLIAQEDVNLHKAILSLSQHGRLQDQYSLIEHQVSAASAHNEREGSIIVEHLKRRERGNS